MKFFDLFSKILSLFYGRNVKEVMDRKRPDRFSWDRGLFLRFLDGEQHIKNSEMLLEKKTHLLLIVAVVHDMCLT